MSEAYKYFPQRLISAFPRIPVQEELISLPDIIASFINDIIATSRQRPEKDCEDPIISSTWFTNNFIDHDRNQMLLSTFVFGSINDVIVVVSYQ
jgi:hypothetical protein